MSDDKDASQPDSGPGGAGAASEAQALAATCDVFLGGGFKAYQPLAGPRSAIDALFLAAACPAEGGQGANILEAGVGCGVVSLAIAMRAPDAMLTGVEVNPLLVTLARRNVELNGLQDRMRIIAGDVMEPPGLFAPQGLVANSYTHVLANPPFYVLGKGRKKKSAAAQRAHMFAPGELGAWIKFLTNCARPKGSLTLIHRADALPELLRLLERRFGALVVYPLYPRQGAPAIRVLIRGVKGSRAPMKLMRGLTLHEANGKYTAAAEAVLRSGERLELL
jgi:tRNA1(Val) A37 N6-methylase TrmN6